MLPKLAPAPDADRPSLRSIREGFRFVVSKKVLLGMFLTDSNAMVFGMPRALFPALAKKFGGGAGLVGALYAAPYAGALSRRSCRAGSDMYAGKGSWSRSQPASGASSSSRSGSPTRSGSRFCFSPAPARPTT